MAHINGTAAVRRLTVMVAMAALAASGRATADSPSSAAVMSTPQTPHADCSAESRRRLFAADALHSALIRAWGPVEGWMPMATRDVVYLAPNHALVRGRDAVRNVLIELEPNAGDVTLTRTLAGRDVSADGRFGFTFGWLEHTAPDASGVATTTYGTYVAAWRCDDGLFRVEAYLAKAAKKPHGTPRAGFPLLVDGSGAGGRPRPGPQKAQESSLMEEDRAFAAASVSEGWSAAFVSWAADFTMDVGGRDFFYLEGAQEISGWYVGWTPAEVLNWSPVKAGASPSGDLGYTVGWSVDRSTNPDGSVSSSYGTYLTVWRRDAGGAWRFIADGGNSSPPP